MICQDLMDCHRRYNIFLNLPQLQIKMYETVLCMKFTAMTIWHFRYG